MGHPKTLYGTAPAEGKGRENTFVKDFLALIKIGIVHSNSITAFAGLWLAVFYNDPDFHVLQYLDKIVFAMIGVWLVIAGSCIINNYLDRDIDRFMSRTKRRPTVTGSFSPRFIIGLGLSFLAIGTLFLLMASVTSAVLGLIGSFIYIFLYTMWTKRKYTLNTVIGSFSGAMPPLIGWAAVDSDLHFAAWVLFLIMFIWQPPHFLALAMRKSEEYRKAGIPMLPVVYGTAMTKRQIMVWILCLLPLPFYLHSLGIPFLILATILNIGWFVLGLVGYKKGNENQWASKMFVYSLNYLTILFVSMVIAPLL